MELIVNKLRINKKFTSFKTAVVTLMICEKLHLKTAGG